MSALPHDTISIAIDLLCIAFFGYMSARAMCNKQWFGAILLLLAATIPLLKYLLQ